MVCLLKRQKAFFAWVTLVSQLYSCVWSSVAWAHSGELESSAVLVHEHPQQSVKTIPAAITLEDSTVEALNQRIATPLSANPGLGIAGLSLLNIQLDAHAEIPNTYHLSLKATGGFLASSTWDKTFTIDAEDRLETIKVRDNTRDAEFHLTFSPSQGLTLIQLPSTFNYLMTVATTLHLRSLETIGYMDIQKADVVHNHGHLKADDGIRILADHMIINHHADGTQPHLESDRRVLLNAPLFDNEGGRVTSDHIFGIFGTQSQTELSLLTKGGTLEGVSGLQLFSHTPVVNAGALCAEQGTMALQAPSLRHEAEGTLEAQNLLYRGDALSLKGLTTISNTLVAHVKDKLDYTTDALKAGQLLKLTFIEGHTLTTPIDTPGHLMIHVDKDATKPLQLMGDVAAEKGIKLTLPAQSALIGTETGALSTIKTKGTFEIWHDGLRDEETVRAIMDKRFGNRLGELPKAEYTIDLQANVKADQGMEVYAPRALWHIGDNARETSPLMQLLQGPLHAYVSAFDLEKGGIAALNADVHAPLGSHIGRLVKHPTRELLATFYCHGQNRGSHSLGHHITGVRYQFLGQELTGVYDGRHLLTLPVAVTNGSFLWVKERTHFKGPFTLHGAAEFNNVLLDSPNDSLVEAGSIKVNNNFTLKGGGHLHIKRYIGDLYFTYYKHNWLNSPLIANKYTYQFAGSDAADVRVYGTLSAEPLSKIFCQASHLYWHNKSPHTVIETRRKSLTNPSKDEDRDFVSTLYQKFVTADEKQALHSNPAPQNLGLSREYKKNGMIPANFIYENGCQGHAISFLLQTNNFEGAQQAFPSILSSDKGAVFPPDTSRLQGRINMPLFLALVGKDGLALGSPNPYYIPPQSPLSDLMATRFNLHTTFVNKDIRESIAKATQPQFHFRFREQFWFEEEKAQQFYEDIRDHVVIADPRGVFKKPEAQVLVSLSPQKLIDRVRDECQEKLFRGYLYDNRIIDAEQVKELHRNTTEYLTASGLSTAHLAQALISQDSRLPEITKPLLFYKGAMNEEGIEELRPFMIFPQKMLDEARGQRGGKIRTHILGIFSKGLTLEKMIEFFKDKPVFQQRLIEFFDQNSTTRRLLTDETLALQAKTHPLEVKVQRENQEEPTGANPAVTLYGEIETKDAAVVTEGTINDHASIKAKNALMASLYGDVNKESLIERVYLGSLYNYVDTIPLMARTETEERQFTYAGRNVIFKGAETASGLGTYTEAGAQNIDMPIALESQQITFFKRGKEIIRAVFQQPSSHTSQTDITWKGDTVIQQATHVKAPEGFIIAKHQIDLPDVHDSRSYSIHRVKKGSMGRKKIEQGYSETHTSKGAQYKVDLFHVRTEHGNVKATNFSNTGKTIVDAPEGVVNFLLGTNRHSSQYIKQSSSLWWQNESVRTEDHLTYAPSSLLGPIEIHAKKAHLQLKPGQDKAYVYSLKQQGVPLTLEYMQDVHHETAKRVSGPGVGLSALVAIAMTLLTQGTGAQFAGTYFAEGTAQYAMAAASIPAISSQLAVGALNHLDNPLKAFDDLVSRDSLRSLAITIGGAGLTQGLCNELKIAKPTPEQLKGLSWTDRLIKHGNYNLISSGVNTTLNMTIGGRKPGEALLDGARGLAVNTIAATVANGIGDQYGNNKMGYVTHKICHGVWGGMTGALLSDDPWKGALSGSLGAVTGEVFAEAFLPDPYAFYAAAAEQGWSPAEIRAAYDDLLHQRAHIAKFLSATTALAFNQDVNIAYMTANNAIENNFVPLAIAGAATAWTAYEMNQAYKEEGLEGAVIEGGKTALLAATGAVGIKITGAAAGKIAAKVSPYALPHVKAFIAYNPELMQLIKAGAIKFENVVTKVKGVPLVQTLIHLDRKVEAAVFGRIERAWGRLIRREVQEINKSLTLTLEYKPGLDKRDFERKVKGLQEAAKKGKLIAKVPHGVSAQERRQMTRDYRKELVNRINALYSENPHARENALARLRRSDIDHMIDLQLSGTNTRANIKALDSLTNQEIGRQISQQLPKGKPIKVNEIRTKKP